jgi:hypothetical protein
MPEHGLLFQVMVYLGAAVVCVPLASCFKLGSVREQLESQFAEDKPALDRSVGVSWSAEAERAEERAPAAPVAREPA